MLADLRKSFDQAFDPDFRWLLVSGVAVALVMLTIGTVIVYWSATFVQDLGVQSFSAGLNQLLSSNVVATMFGLSVILMVPIAAFELGVFKDRVATAVEQVYYPLAQHDADTARPQRAFSSLRILFLLLISNAVLGVVFLAAPVLALALFWVVNGFLLGREFFYMIAIRRLDPLAALEQRDNHKWRIFVAGYITVVALSVPVLNLVVPVIAMTMFTHMVSRISPRKSGFLARLDEHRKWYSDRADPTPEPKVQPQTVMAQPAPVADIEPTAAVQPRKATRKSVNVEVDPDDPTTWNNIFSDLARPRRARG